MSSIPRDGSSIYTQNKWLCVLFTQLVIWFYEAKRWNKWTHFGQHKCIITLGGEKREGVASHPFYHPLDQLLSCTGVIQRWGIAITCKNNSQVAAPYCSSFLKVVSNPPIVTHIHMIVYLLPLWKYEINFILSSDIPCTTSLSVWRKQKEIEIEAVTIIKHARNQVKCTAVAHFEGLCLWGWVWCLSWGQTECLCPLVKFYTQYFSIPANTNFIASLHARTIDPHSNTLGHDWEYGNGTAQ